MLCGVKAVFLHCRQIILFPFGRENEIFKGLHKTHFRFFVFDYPAAEIIGNINYMHLPRQGENRKAVLVCKAYDIGGNSFDIGTYIKHHPGGSVGVKIAGEFKHTVVAFNVSDTRCKDKLAAVEKIGNLSVLHHMHPSDGVFYAAFARNKLHIVFRFCILAKLTHGYRHFASPHIF